MSNVRFLPVILFLFTLAARGQQSFTAAQVVEKMRFAAGVTTSPDTVDTFKAGDPNDVVTGIATTISPTMDVLRKAVAAKDNLIITHEPTFYNHQDAGTMFVNDPVYAEKQAYIRDHHLIIFRWHDGWHQRKPDGILEGWEQKVGWHAFQRAGQPYFYTLPSTTLGALAQQLQAKTGARVVRVIGNPSLSVSRVVYAPGAPGEGRQVKALEQDDVDVLVVGEIPEWETISYVWDASQQGRPKGMILMGHYTSEEPGMDFCATWLRGVVHGIKVDFIPAGEPYWLAGHPPAQH